MSIPIKEGSTKRDWVKLGSAAAEIAFKSLTLGKDGFSAAISPLFRIFEALRGNDSIERRATNLVLETIGYSIAKTVSSIQLARSPLKPELEAIVEHLLARVQTLAEQKEILLRASHLEHPGTFELFDDIASHIFHELKLNEPKTREAEVNAIFRMAVAEGLNRIRTRSPEYYAPIFEALSGSTAILDAKARAWTDYRELLVRRFEDEPLFGEDATSGVKLGQAYQSLRGFWSEEDEEGASATSRPKKLIHLQMLDAIITEWLEENNPLDRIRLVSGGPGSGKSTFAKNLAAMLAVRPHWRVVFVPLQRLKGTGPLEGRINEYFRLQVDEPFELETAPLLSMGRDGHHEWLIIFDGLDELAKEGASSESAAQDFASALADWRGRIGEVAVRFLVLGRAPSMQEARRRLGLQGKGTVHVAGMAPFSKIEGPDHERISYNDPSKLRDIDQRSDFWSRWAIAKGLSIEPPEAMKVDQLLDLTNEPLLAYLLIISGYVSERWQEAAENRNRIYQAIFDQIWERERTKQTRIHLNDLGQEGFESLLQALGIAAWRGGGRTGDEATFITVRDNFMRPDLLSRAKSGGTAELSNVALLFYTRKDEEGGRGYEFLHKSFGEYLTARGLFNAFLRWGAQADDPKLDFSLAEFLSRWLRLTGPAPITREIVTFLRNEVRLWGSATQVGSPWEGARKVVRIAERLVDSAVREGLPAHELGLPWRQSELQERNGEEALLAILDALARVAYPDELLNASPMNGGWTAGPVQVPEFRTRFGFLSFIKRLSSPSEGWLASFEMFATFPNTPLYSLLSRLSLKGGRFFGLILVNADLSGTDFEGSMMAGASFIHSNLSGSNFAHTDLDFATFIDCDLKQTDFAGAQLSRVSMDKSSAASSGLSKVALRKISKMGSARRYRGGMVRFAP